MKKHIINDGVTSNKNDNRKLATPKPTGINKLATTIYVVLNNIK
jgi:hypothetical protein